MIGLDVHERVGVPLDITVGEFTVHATPVYVGRTLSHFDDITVSCTRVDLPELPESLQRRVEDHLADMAVRGDV